MCIKFHQKVKKKRKKRKFWTFEVFLGFIDLGTVTDSRQRQTDIVLFAFNVQTPVTTVSPLCLSFFLSSFMYCYDHCNAVVYDVIQERYWRKNRRRNPGYNCIGVDLNRNFDVSWGSTFNSAFFHSLTYNLRQCFSMSANGSANGIKSRNRN